MQTRSWQHLGISKRRQQRARNQRREQARQAARRPAPKAGVPPAAIAAGVVGLVAAVVIVFIATRPGANPGPVPTPSGSSAAALVQQLASISPAELDQIGAGAAGTSKFGAITGQPALTSDGKPEVLYMGAEYCPFCAAERWALIVALSRFGTLGGVDFMTSSSTDAYPDTPTWTFRSASYTSQYLSFVAVEQEDRSGNALQHATSAETALEDKYASGIPFIDFGNRIYLSGATYSPDDLQGLQWQEIVAKVQDPTTSEAKEILGSANYLTAAICRTTGGRPAPVCSDPVIRRLDSALPKS